MLGKNKSLEEEREMAARLDDLIAWLIKNLLAAAGNSAVWQGR